MSVVLIKIARTAYCSTWRYVFLSFHLMDILKTRVLFVVLNERKKLSSAMKYIVCFGPNYLRLYVGFVLPLQDGFIEFSKSKRDKN